MTSFANRIQSTLDESKNDMFIQSILNRIDSIPKLIMFLHRFTLYNRNFPGGVASLAAAFHVRRPIYCALHGCI